jgi:hypothetical protein
MYNREYPVIPGRWSEGGRSLVNHPCKYMIFLLLYLGTALPTAAGYSRRWSLVGVAVHLGHRRVWTEKVHQFVPFHVRHSGAGIHTAAR